jgi:hypothetical protein
MSRSGGDLVRPGGLVIVSVLGASVVGRLCGVGRR